ncbi:MAG: glycosyltransferase family 39 protein [Bryobacteraceae bacterium]
MRRLLPLLAFVVLLRIPFLTQPIQGDDVYYLAAAQHAQIDPWHPHHARYVFLGKWVDMRGHPHPPGNAWVLAGLLAVFGDIREVPFHAVYVVFSLVGAAAMWSLARRFSSRPVWATLLFLATPALLVNGNSLEADVPFLALWMASFALWLEAVERRSVMALAGAAAAIAAASLFAYQAVAAIPILALYLWQRARDWRAAWPVVLTPVVVIGGWQLWERISSGALPASILAGYFQSYGLQSLANKLRNAGALVAHLPWVVVPAIAVGGRGLRIIAAFAAGAGAVAVDSNPLFWVSFGAGVLVLISLPRSFLSAWILIFFASALVLFFAGSARYLLPIAAPLAILASNQISPRGLAAGFAVQLALGLGLAAVNYLHWDGYRDFVASLRREFDGRRVWVNGELGMKFYAETEGALPLEQGQAVRPGEIVISSPLAFAGNFTTGGGALTTLAEREIRPALPLRLIGLGVRSAWSTATLGLRPFDISTAPVDVARAQLVVERKPALSWLPMSAPEAESQIVSGVHNAEGGGWRWMGARAVLLLKAAPARLRVEYHVPAQAVARRITLRLGDRLVAESALAPGTHALASDPQAPAGDTATLVIEVDRTFSVPGDHRELGIILSGAGFR